MTDGRPLYVGAISGTSVDGLDLALLAIRGPAIELRAGRTVPFAAALAASMHDLASGRQDDLDALGAADRALADAIAEAILTFLSDLGVPTHDVRAIGSHGQTVRHRPDGPHPFTLQIGDPNRIAEITGIDCVADFRRRDMAAGGQGAPLVPPFHRALFERPGSMRVVVNIGGIANITVLPGTADVELHGFDTGPGNTLLDHWSRLHLRRPYDDGGRWAASGRVSVPLLEHSLEDPYFGLPPPKRTGRETFSPTWLGSQLDHHPGLRPEDVQATLAALTARSIADAVRAHADGAQCVIVCGGGRHNTAIMGFLSDALPRTEVTTSDALGVDGDFIEAGAFAWLAHRTVHGLAGNAPRVTGAGGPRVLGAIFSGSRG
jgi:anhydro-N-acetylmuramic acid kinase